MHMKKYCLDIDPDRYLLGELLGFLGGAAVEQPPVDPGQPYEPAHVGLFPKTLAVDGVQRRILTYIPPHFPTSGAGLFVFLDDGVDSGAFFADGGWEERCTRMGTALILMEAADGGWSRENIQHEINFAQAAFKTAIARDLYSLNESTYYAVGLGAGAYPAAAFSLLFSSVFSGLVADGDCALHPDLLEQLGSLPSDGDRAIPKSRVKLPAWIIDRTGGAAGLLDYLKRANDVVDESLHNGLAAVYRQDARHPQAWINGLPLAEVWYTADKTAVCYDEMVAFLLRVKRWMSGGDNNGDFRAARTAEDMGLKYFEKDWDGRKRHWYVYAPSAYKKNPHKKYPAVLAIHGYSCTGKLYAENAEWHTVGEKRDFFVIYPTAYPGCVGGACTPLPLWNCDQFSGETGIDDVGFLLSVIEDVKKTFPIDESRVYCAGHSNGSAMTQLLMERAPDVFAAFGPVGYTFGEPVEANGEPRRPIAPPADGKLRPVWLIKGEHDVGDAARLDPESSNTSFLRTMCAANGCDFEAERTYENGAYIHHLYRNAQGVPLVRFSEIRDLPHAYSPEMAQMTWDEFFCRFRRSADGGTEYLG